ILGSSSLPGIFQPVEINGMLYLDGGTLMNTPLIPAVHGCDVLHVAYIDPPLSTIALENLQTTVGVVDRLRTTTFAFALDQDVEMIGDFDQSLALLENPAMLDQDLAVSAASVRTWLQANPLFTPTTIHRYVPSSDLGGPLGFLDLSYDQVAALIDRGYNDAVQHDCVASGCAIPG